jgi:hypothetical protein
MPRFTCVATVDFYYIVAADTEAEALALLTETLGPNWGVSIDSPYIEEHPQIEGPEYDAEVSCLGPELVPG